jgi:ABC-2 type transport system permease protein
MKTIVTTMRAAFAEAWANRTSFWTQISIMVLNDVAWIVFWLLFFHRVGAMRGWDRSKVLLLLAVLTTGAGIVLAFFSNSRRIGTLIRDGGIDAALALPVRPLAYLLVRRVDAVNLGDAAFGLALFCALGRPTPERLAIYVAGSLLGAVVFASFLVIVGSSAFFVGRGEPGDLGMHAILLLSTYPVDIFTGANKLMLYTVIPAAFVSSVPARLIDHFDVRTAVVFAGLAAGIATLAVYVFGRGLRRYTSSALWTRA